MEQYIVIFELLGTIAFSISGAMTGLRKNMDIFGVMILGLTTAVGGGMIRDMLLGLHPPRVFQSPVYILVAMTAALLTFLPAVRRWMVKRQRMYDELLRIMDALGLGVFTVMGIRVGVLVGHGLDFFLLVFLGVVNGVGGGVLRDIMAGDRPYIFVKHIYACASIVGAALCVMLWKVIGQVPAMMLGLVMVVTLRLLAAHFCWSLPKAREIKEDEGKRA